MDEYQVEFRKEYIVSIMYGRTLPLSGSGVILSASKWDLDQNVAKRAFEDLVREGRVVKTKTGGYVLAGKAQEGAPGQTTSKNGGGITPYPQVKNQDAPGQDMAPQVRPPEEAEKPGTVQERSGFDEEQLEILDDECRQSPAGGETGDQDEELLISEYRAMHHVSRNDAVIMMARGRLEY